MMDARKNWSFIGLFVIALVISLPFHSANALAVSVSVTKNTGDAEIPGFINGDGDNWLVEATINDLGEQAEGFEVNPENVKIKIGSNQAPFQSCVTSQFDETICSYLSPLDGINSDGKFNFQVLYNYVDENIIAQQVSSLETSISIDGTSPLINFIGKFKQVADGPIKGNFDVNDKFADDPSVGLDVVEILNSETGEVLQTIELAESEVEEFNFVNDGETQGNLDVTLSGEGELKIRLRAIDRLGHETFSSVKAIDYDYSAPEIDSGSLIFEDIGDFLGPFEKETDIILQLTETNDLKSVIASSDQADFGVSSGQCEKVDTNEDGEEVDNLWECRWDNVEIKPGEEISLSIRAEDEFSNVKETSIGKELAQDIVPPMIEFFGTNRQYEEISYVNPNEENTLVIRVKESGSGVSEDTIAANLLAFGEGSFKHPDLCEQEEELYICNWKVNLGASASSVPLNLPLFTDKVGNEGTVQEVELIVDSAKPKLEKIEFYGSSEVGEKDYFESQDRIHVVAEVREPTGLMFLVDMSDLSNDPAIEYPAGEFNEDGYAVFTEDDCERKELEEGIFDESLWVCSFETGKVKSGTGSKVSISLMVTDTAGNRVDIWPESKNTDLKTSTGEEGRYSFTLLGSVDEVDPDHWGVGDVEPMIPFIDMDTTELINTRMSFDVELKSKSSNAKLHHIELVGCITEKEGLSLGRQVIWGNRYSDAKSSPANFKLVLEFPSMNSKEIFSEEMSGTGEFETATAKFVCQVKLNYQLGKNALKFPEFQEIELEVPFGFTELGAQDDSLKDTIAQEKEAVESGFWGFIGIMKKVLDWLGILVDLYETIYGVVVIYNIATTVFSTEMDAVGHILIPLTAATDAAKISFCMGANLGEVTVSETVEMIKIPIDILTCRLTPCSKIEGFGDNWYETYVCFFTNLYNSYAGKLEGMLLSWDTKAEAIPSVASTYDNLYLSAASLCLPGLIYNANKFREIKCRHISCLEDDITQGIATKASCDQLQEVLSCKYFFGPLFQLIPFVAMWDALLKGIQTLITDPIAIISTSIIAGCSISCIVSGQLSAACVQSYFGIKVLSFIETIWGTVEKYISMFGEDGPSFCDQVLEDDESSPAEEGESAEPSPITVEDENN